MEGGTKPGWQPRSSPAYKSCSGQAGGKLPPGTQRTEAFRLILDLSASIVFMQERWQPGGGCEPGSDSTHTCPFFCPTRCPFPHTGFPHAHFLTLGMPFPPSLISSGLCSNIPPLQFPGGWEPELGGQPARGSARVHHCWLGFLDRVAWPPYDLASLM